MLTNLINNLDKINKEIENILNTIISGIESVDITEDQIRSIFGKFKEIVLTRNLSVHK